MTAGTENLHFHLLYGSEGTKKLFLNRIASLFPFRNVTNGKKLLSGLYDKCKISTFESEQANIY